MKDNFCYDIVIVGSGIVGLTFANIMAQNSALKIALVSGDDPEARQDNGRVCALNHSSLKLFKKLHLADDSYSYYDKVFVWKSGGIGSLAFDASEFGYNDLGAIVNNLALEDALWQKVKAHSNIAIFCGALAKSLSKKQNYALLLEDGCKISAKLLVGADGASSWVRENLNIKSSTESYDQDAIVATLSTAELHNNTAWQKFVATGTIALLPLQDESKSSLVWSCRTDIARSLMSLPEHEFAQVLSKECDYKFGDIKVVTKRASFPLRSMHADTYIGANAAIIGDAAHVVHPLAGQGVNYGILDAAVLSKALLPIADFNNIQDSLIYYARRRRGQNGFDVWLLSQIKYIFTVDNGIVAGMLSLGMNMINSSTVMKKRLLAKSLGLGGAKL
jgi:2-polyprenylphenol 6-hydroxylase